LLVGGNYTFISSDLDNPEDPEMRVALPCHKLFVYAKWAPIPALTIQPNILYESGRYADTSAPISGRRIGNRTLLGLRIGYQVTPQWDISLIGNNLTDKNYQISDGYPLEGRNYVLSTRLQF